MSRKQIRNVPASIRSQLLHLSKQRGEAWLQHKMKLLISVGIHLHAGKYEVIYNVL
jgi:hypothetical protein